MMWLEGSTPPAFDASRIVASLARVRELVHLVRDRAGGIGIGVGGRCVSADDLPLDRNGSHAEAFELVGSLPPIYPEWLGGRAFTDAHRVRFPYVAGEMANGIATPRLVMAMARAGMLGFFGAAGLPLALVEAGIDEIERNLSQNDDPRVWGANLIHSPADPALESAVAELYLRRRVTHISASAFMALTAAVVRCSASGLRRDPSGQILRQQRIFAKVSRREVATAFMAPAPHELLDALVVRGELTPSERALALEIPVAEDVTVEADSGGHTDNRPLGALLPSLRCLRDELMARYRFASPIRLGAAGGLGEPAAVAAAFALGADYVVTGSINQSALESGLSSAAKAELARAGVADVMMAPAADMFELGVKVQVLRRGTMFGARAQRLYELYRAHDSLEAMPAEVRARLEREILGASCDEVWASVQRYFEAHDRDQLRRAAREPRHRMALVFRWYLGLSSRWAIEGHPGRELDYQIWCGPAMGAFNDWVKGSFLEHPEQRSVVQIALNLLEGAAVLTRAQQLRAAGVMVPTAAFRFTPRPLA